MRHNIKLGLYFVTVAVFLIPAIIFSSFFIWNYFYSTPLAFDSSLWVLILLDYLLWILVYGMFVVTLRTHDYTMNEREAANRDWWPCIIFTVLYFGMVGGFALIVPTAP